MHDPDNDYESIGDNADPFADESEAPNPFGESEDFGAGVGGDSGGDDGDVFEIPLLPIGVLDGYVKSAKRFVDDKAKIILSIQPSTPPFQTASPAETWFDTRNARQFARLLQIATALEVPLSKSGGRITFVGGIPAAFKDKPGKFVFSSWDKNDGTSDPQLAWGLPKPGKSAAWDEHMKALAEADESFTDAQLKILKSSPGVVPSDF